jgi:hypothetical protein
MSKKSKHEAAPTSRTSTSLDFLLQWLFKIPPPSEKTVAKRRTAVSTTAVISRSPDQVVLDGSDGSNPPIGTTEISDAESAKHLDEQKNDTDNRQIEQLLVRISIELAGDLGKPQQQELAYFLDILLHIQRAPNTRLVEETIALGVMSLFGGNPKLTFAKNLRKSLQRYLHVPFWRVASQFLVSRSPATSVIAGLLVVFFITLPLYLIYLPGFLATSPAIFGIDSQRLVLVGVAGALGSIVSIMVRLKDFVVSTRINDPMQFFFTGCFKPVVGAAFAIFAYALISSELIPIRLPDPNNESFFFLAISFIAGFSERFGKDIAAINIIPSTFTLSSQVEQQDSIDQTTLRTPK